ncbi:MAG: hypothetical protein ACE5H9_21640, partial [Anaerolineae bacterium]
IKENEEKLTKAIARQFPILSGQERFDAAMAGESQPDAICKILGITLGVSAHKWLYLVEDKEGGLAWVPPVLIYKALADSVIQKGGWIDDPAKVSTVVL